MSRRLIAMVLTLGLVLALSSVSLAAVKLTFWDMFSGGDGEFMTALIKEFNETHPDIEVEETVITWGDYYNRLMTASLAGKGPDVGVMHSIGCRVETSQFPCGGLYAGRLGGRSVQWKAICHPPRCPPSSHVLQQGSVGPNWFAQE